jgi:hypothetical protein
MPDAWPSVMVEDQEWFLDALGFVGLLATNRDIRYSLLDVRIDVRHNRFRLKNGRLPNQRIHPDEVLKAIAEEKEWSKGDEQP